MSSPASAMSDAGDWADWLREQEDSDAGEGGGSASSWEQAADETYAVDSETSVPVDLYEALLARGQRALHGCHRVIITDDGRGAQRLVRSRS
mmetsp:Transcript_81878/g.228155  ORF Transcript_81878/g.228155 Transcript_81878/m.228155 type:complete len:92 (+) Transcript_81878:85-360(+)